MSMEEQALAGLRRFDLNLLTALDALLDARGVTAAARRCHVTQSTMSGTLRRLRDQFSDPLLVRDGNSYGLSPLATSLRQPVRQLLLQAGSLLSAGPLFDPRTDRRRFRIMAADYSVTVHLAKLFRRIGPLAPHVSYEVVPISSPLDSVRSGTVDMCLSANRGLRAEAEAGADPLLRVDVLFSDRYCCVVDQNHPLRGTVRLDQIFAFVTSWRSSPACAWHGACCATARPWRPAAR